MDAHNAPNRHSFRHLIQDGETGLCLTCDQAQLLDAQDAPIELKRQL